jgi:hypothetical protein
MVFWNSHQFGGCFFATKKLESQNPSFQQRYSLGQHSDSHHFAVFDLELDAQK